MLRAIRWAAMALPALIVVVLITHSILMRSQSRSVRYIRTVHDLDFKTIRRSPDRKDHYV